MPRHKLPNLTFKYTDTGNPEAISFSYFTPKSRNPPQQSYLAFHGDLQQNKDKGLHRRIILGKNKQKSKRLNPLSVFSHTGSLSISLSSSICISLSSSGCLLVPHLYIHSVSCKYSKFLIHLFLISCNLHQFPAHNPLGYVQQSARTSSVEVPCS